MSLADQSARPVRSLAPALFTATIFLSATLLFFVQPLFAKLILPRIGGAPAVWTTAMLFFQTVLIAGYLYAHLMIRLVPLRAQLWVHLAFWAAALMFLPLSVSEAWAFDPSGSMAVQTLWLLALGVGVPFAMLSANAPLLQAWYARSGGPSAEDPYFLYGASNLGSLIALLAFPLVAEPLFGGRDIGFAWAAGFVLLGLGLGFSGCAAVRANIGAPQKAAPPKTKLGLSQLALWAFIAFVPSSLMLAVTTEISTDLGSFPLIWVVPLAIYILSFVLTFSQRALPASLTRPAALLSVIVMAVLVSNQANAMPAWVKALLFAPALLAVAVEAHRLLYARRPEAGHLTVFYITMSVGGALGGLANSIIAPWVFSGVHEGLVSVLLAGGLLLLGSPRICHRTYLRAVIGGLLAIAFLYGWNGLLVIPLPPLGYLALAAGFALWLALHWREALPVLAGLMFFLGVDWAADTKPYLFKDRSFFGAHSVRDDGDLRIYANGTTVHGLQRVDEAGARPTPLSYYHPQSPMAELITAPEGRAAGAIGIVGLGVGSLACYAEPGQDWAFYEIDPMVDQVARDPRLFTFMSDCAGDAPTHLGDARIVLDRQDVTYDILLLDAYSSDAIPVHLVTAEAVQLYLERLTTGGLLVFHISNRYYDISQPLARIGGALGLTMAIRSDVPGENTQAGAKASVVVAMSLDPARMAPVMADTRWQPLTSDGGPVWTDDYANLLGALR